jgi:hypothetical protein
MKIIAFGHRRYVGKDTAANLLVTHIRATRRNVLVTKMGFASKFKAICHELYGWAGLQDEEYYEVHPELKDVIIPALGKSPRTVWIEFGTTVGRAIFPDTWIMYPLTRKCDFLVMKDLRFPNEAIPILQRGGLVYRIDNPRVEIFNDKADSALAGFTHWTGVIVNDSDIRTLNQKVLTAIGDYVK